jgi:mono/diheme cytochrome c family protein
MTMMTRTITSLLTVAGLFAGLAAAPGFAQQSEPNEAALIAKGAYIARAGDCVACHTAPGGEAFAGGLAIESDLGRIFSTNITPDKENGIGAYTEAEFAAALRQGVRADGTHLYPAMPYTAYGKVTDEDIHALYFYFMKGVAAVANRPPETALAFPFNQRWGMALWNYAFATAGGFRPDPAASAEVNRGAYLVEGLAHCGTCHTPRGFGMQEKGYDAGSKRFLAGGDLNGWNVPSLRTATTAAKGFSTWSVDEITDYLGSGRNDHAAVGGEMKSVVDNSLAHLTDADLHAIAVYLKTIVLPSASEAATGPADNSDKAKATTAKLTAAVALTGGERLYLDNCGACHFVTGEGASRIFPALNGSSLVNGRDPVGLLALILGGAATPSTDRSPSMLPMPGFAKRLSDAEVAELATFLRSGWTNHASAVTAGQVATVRAKYESLIAHRKVDDIDSSRPARP